VRQCDLTWKNIGRILRSAGMGFGNIVRATGFITDSRFIAPYRDARAKILKEPFPAATLIVVSGLADPGMFVEIEIVAARA
jgi:2-iminobutanoate/2-iminopropanoate deaminase